MADETPIESILEQARAALERNELKDAEHYYSLVTGHPTANPESDLFKQASWGLREVRRRRGEPTGPLEGGGIETNGGPLPSGSDGDSLPHTPHLHSIPSAPQTEVLSPGDPARSSTTIRLQEDGVHNQEMEAPDEHPSDHSVTRDQKVQQQIQDLDQQARSLEQRPTGTNYKQAIALYTRILDYGEELSEPQHSEYQRRLQETEAAYEAFRERYGELSTARQLANQEYEVIAVRKLLNQGQEKGPDNEILDDKFADLLDSVRHTLLKVASERVEQAQIQVADGRDLLDLNQLNAAVRRYDEAIALIEGKEMRGQDTSPETTTAITAISNMLVNNEEVRASIKKYTDARAEVQKLRDTIERIVPLYIQAETHFKAKAFADAITELESLRGRAGEQFQVALVDNLFRQANERWSEETHARADQLLAMARAAHNQGDQEQVQHLASEVIGLEPHLQTETIKHYREEARKLLESVGAEERRFMDLVNRAGQSHAHREFDEAGRLLREVLNLRPEHKPARKMLDEVHASVINASLRDTDHTLSSPTEQGLTACRTALNTHRRSLGEISNRNTRRGLEARIDETLSQIERALQRLRDREEEAKRLRELLDQAGQQASLRRFPEALETLGEAENLSPHNPEIENQRMELFEDWALQLKSQARSHLDNRNPSAAREALDKLVEIGVKDPSTVEMHRQARSQVYKEQGKGCLGRDDYRGAIQAFLEANPHDPEVITDLRTARHKEAHRLLDQGQWEEVLDVLQQVDATDPRFSGLFLRARAELTLKRANEAITDQDFEVAATYLDEATSVSLADIQDRVTTTRHRLKEARADLLLAQVEDAIDARDFESATRKLRAVEQMTLKTAEDRVASLQTQLNTVQKAHGVVQDDEREAEEYYQRFQQTRRTSDLLEAIRTLNKALNRPELSGEAMSMLRASLEKRRTEYQAGLTDERSNLLKKARHSLAKETVQGLQEAYRQYQEVLALSPHRYDPDAEDGIQEVRQKLQDMRRDLDKRTSALLNLDGPAGQPRGIRPEEVENLLRDITEVQDATRNIQDDDLQAQRELSKAQTEVEEAHKALKKAENALDTTCTLWIEQRQRGKANFTQLRTNFQDITKYFEAHKYTHLELDWSRAEHIIRRLDTDRDAYQQMGKSLDVCYKALEKNETDAVVSHFHELAQSEEIILTNTNALANRVKTLQVPQTISERYPRQNEVLSHLAERIEKLTRQEKEALSIEVLRQTIQQKKSLLSLFETLDRDNRFGLHDQDVNESPDLRKLEEWDTKWTEGRTFLETADTLRREAEQAGKEQRWNDGIETYHQAQSSYASARSKLEGTTEGEETPYRSIQELHKSIQIILKRVQEAERELEEEKPWVQYQRHIDEALNYYNQARSALQQEHFSDAIELAQRAAATNPALEENALRVIRHAREEQSAPGFPTGLVVLIVLFILILGVSIFLGPSVLAWFREYLFPPTAVGGGI